MRTMHRFLLLATALVALLAVMFVLAGCSAKTRIAPTGMPATPASSSSMKMAITAADKTDPNAQSCITCSLGKKAPAVSGSTVTASGTQLIDVAIKDGTYSPNRFTAKAGTPIDVKFTVDGKPVKGCLSMPTFKSLGKSITLTTGTKTVSLGALAPGTYEFTCSMGMNAGQIVVQ